VKTLRPVHFEYDAQADAVYLRLRDEPYSHGANLDDSRRIDYGADGDPIGIELLDVSLGVKIDGLPRGTQVKRLLIQHHIRIATAAPGAGT